MQLALTPEVLFPLGACAVVAAAVIAVVVVLVRSRGATADDDAAPTSADWTGEAATADPAPAERRAFPALPPRLTVAEAVAVREADTAPLPVVSAAYVRGRHVRAPVRSGDGAVRGPGEPAGRVGVAAGAADPAHSAERARPAETGRPAERARPAETAGSDEATHAVEAAHSVEAAQRVEAAHSAETVVTTENVDPVESADAAPVAADPAAGPVDAAVGSRATSSATVAGSSPTVAVAVAHALAARAAAHRGPVDPPVPSRTADARDRLLAVLLADPVRAVGAAEELATCRGQLGEVLARLAASGLNTDQLARLSGFSAEQVTTLLARQNA